eukprot:7325241-Karenia_brevis.AAC.1
MGATQMHLMEMGWEMQWYPGQIRLRDHLGGAWQPHPQYGMGLLRSMMEGPGRNSYGKRLPNTDMGK